MSSTLKSAFIVGGTLAVLVGLSTAFDAKGQEVKRDAATVIVNCEPVAMVCLQVSDWRLKCYRSKDLPLEDFEIEYPPVE